MLPSPTTAVVDAPRPATKPVGRALTLLTLAALVLRVAFVLLEPTNRLAGDEFTWTGWAWGQVEGLTSPRVAFSPFRSEMIFYPPLYAYFLAGSRVLLGSITAVKLLQALVSALLVPAIGRVGTLLAGRRAGLISAACVAFYPELIWYAAHFWCETLFLTLTWWSLERLLTCDVRMPGGRIPSGRVARRLRAAVIGLAPLATLRLIWGHSLEAIAGAALLLLVLVGVLGLWRLLARDDAALDAAAVAGGLWGLATLTRETLLYFAPVVLLWLLWRRRDGLARAAAFAIPLLLVVAPWTYRNYVVTHAFVPVATSGALNLWQGNTSVPREQVYVLSEAVRGPGHVRIAQYRYHWNMAIEAIRERQPRWLLDKLVAEMPAFWEADSLVLIHLTLKRAYGPFHPAMACVVAIIVVLPYLALLVSGLVGALHLRLGRTTLLLLGFLVYYNLIHVVTHGFSRYRLPVLPVVFCVAALAIAGKHGDSATTPTRRRRLCVAFLGVALLLSLVPSLSRMASEPAFRRPAAEAVGPGGVRR